MHHGIVCVDCFVMFDLFVLSILLSEFLSSATNIVSEGKKLPHGVYGSCADRAGGAAACVTVSDIYTKARTLNPCCFELMHLFGDHLCSCEFNFCSAALLRY